MTSRENIHEITVEKTIFSTLLHDHLKSVVLHADQVFLNLVFVLNAFAAKILLQVDLINKSPAQLRSSIHEFLSFEDI